MTNNPVPPDGTGSASNTADPTPLDAVPSSNGSEPQGVKLAETWKNRIGPLRPVVVPPGFVGRPTPSAAVVESLEENSNDGYVLPEPINWAEFWERETPEQDWAIEPIPRQGSADRPLR